VTVNEIVRAVALGDGGVGVDGSAAPDRCRGDSVDREVVAAVPELPSVA
jgi:hypothetical protein